MHNPVTGVAFAIYYPMFAAFAVPANLVAIVILSRGRCCLSRCITQYMVSMAVADLLVVVTAVILNRIRGIYFPRSFLTHTTGCSVTAVITYAARDSSVWLTVAFTLDRYIVICCPKLKSEYCTEKTSVLVIVTVCIFSFLKNLPCYFMYEPLYVLNGVPWFCTIRSVFYSTAGWAAFDWLDKIFTPFVPFVLIVLFNGLTVRHILAANKARRRLQVRNKGTDQSDPELENRRKSVVLLLSVSGTFILLWMTYLVNLLFVRLTSNSYFEGLDYSDPRFILQESGYMLELWSCCTNTCIYAGTQRKFREELIDATKYPFRLFTKLMNY